MNNPKAQSKKDALLKLIADEIATAPVEVDGFEWCALPQPEIAAKVGASVATVRRLVSGPPFVRQHKEIDGTKRVLLREGVPGPITPRHAANKMSKIWSSRLASRKQKLEQERDALMKSLPGVICLDAQEEAQKRIKEIQQELEKRRWKTTRREYGCMFGLAEVWPEGHQAELFKLVLDNWPFFMEGVKYAMFNMEEAGEKPTKLYFRFPSLSVVRAFADVALEIAEMKIQASGKPPPPWIKAMNPQIWKSVPVSKLE